MESIVRYEELPAGMVSRIQSALPGIQGMILRASEIEPRFGCGVYKIGKCVWLKDGCRLSLSPVDGGGLIGSVSREPDPLHKKENRP